LVESHIDMARLPMKFPWQFPLSHLLRQAQVGDLDFALQVASEAAAEDSSAISEVPQLWLFS
jgi:hypothetical protein